MPSASTKPAAKARAAKAPARRAPAPKPTTAMDLMARALSSKLPAESLAELSAFIERERTASAEQAYISAMLDFKTNDLPEILRNETGTLQGDDGPVEYDYATLDRLCEHLIPALAKHGIIHSYETPESGAIAENGMLRITAILSHKLGHRERATLQAPQDGTNGKNAVQAIGSTATYLQRYTLLLVCGVAVKQLHDDDARAAGAAAAGQAGPQPRMERRQQPRNTTYVTEGSHPIAGPDLARAIRQIKGGSYEYQSLVSYYALTRPQLEEVHTALGMPAPGEEVAA